MIHADDVGLRRVALAEAVTLIGGAGESNIPLLELARRTVGVAEILEKFLNDAKSPDAVKARWAEWLESHPDEASVISEVLFDNSSSNRK